MTDPAPQTPPSLPTLWEIFLVFARIGVSSFGGGLSGWLMREFVTRRRLLSEADFLSGLALSQGLPGINVVNLSIWIGYRLRGGAGATVASLGMIVPPMMVAILMMIILEQIGPSEHIRLLLAGIAAAALGLALEMGVRSARFVIRDFLPSLIMIGVFVCIVFLQLSLIKVVLVFAPLSILQAWFRLGPQEADKK